MDWASERVQAVFEALDGAFAGDGIVVAVAAVDSASSGPAFAVTEGLPEDARFEIGSITKTMTAALLASLAGDGVLALDDGIGRWLDAGPNGNITLEQLATHTSGLPRLAPNQPADEANPYRDFTAERAGEGLRTATRTPDAGHLYSNFGYQLLGLVLERASGQRYQHLLTERLLRPLGMTRSGVGGAGGGTRLTGHAGGSQPALGLRATRSRRRGSDHRRPGALRGRVPGAAPARSAPRSGCASSRARRTDGQPAGGLAWLIVDGLLFHNGGTGGFSASMTIDQAAGHAVAALVNTHGSSAPLLDAVAHRPSRATTRARSGHGTLGRRRGLSGTSEPGHWRVRCSTATMPALTRCCIRRPAGSLRPGASARCGSPHSAGSATPDRSRSRAAPSPAAWPP